MPDIPIPRRPQRRAFGSNTTRTATAVLNIGQRYQGAAYDPSRAPRSFAGYRAEDLPRGTFYGVPAPEIPVEPPPDTFDYDLPDVNVPLVRGQANWLLAAAAFWLLR